jgi:hypothetical protein
MQPDLTLAKLSLVESAATQSDKPAFSLIWVIIYTCLTTGMQIALGYGPTIRDVQAARRPGSFSWKDAGRTLEKY